MSFYSNTANQWPTRFANLFGLLTLLACTAPEARSQIIQTPASEEQRRRAQADAEERQRLLREPSVELRTPILPSSETTEILVLPGESPCFTIHQLSLTVSPQLSREAKIAGASELALDPFFFAQEYLQQYKNVCVGKDGLNLIIKRLTNLILQKGYSTTRVGISEQDLSTGVLTLTLVPGLIHSIHFTDSSSYGTWRNAFPTGPGKLLNLRDLEQGLEQMKRVPFQDVDMQIVPTDEAGESDVILNTNRTKAWKLTATLDNSGAKGTGQLQAGGNFSLDNLFGLSDLFNIGINTDADRKGDQRGTNGHNLYYSLPFGYWNYSISASDYDYHQEIAGNNQTFVSSGKSKNAEFKINQLIQRDQTQKNSWQLKIGKRWSRSFIDEAEIDVQKRNITFVELGWIHKHYFGNAQLDLTLANRWGTSWLGGKADLEGRNTDEPTFTYALQTIDATLTAPFQIANQPLRYIGTLRGQTSHSALYLADQFSIGGRYTVRGFDGELTLTAERGFYLRNELDIPIANSGQSAYIGMDFGKVYGSSAQYLIGDKLAGTTLGIRGAYHGFMYDLFSSWPVNKPAQFKTATPSVGFNLTFQY
ncbi:ShlB/FhaC/HecB family hemolysin secretion/activation protein [Solimicrobium silvestre]|uniref:Hemolysin activation/secretion protein n=1 Tax=Solimicrobium silvestre TaxID=2099400 RepID=A0A2S9GSB9_9BURK|nr:ShlB/FhaC/HecB family hemolysin secretion/activation protein [Solimicrobium silvestre]PRC90619.1 Hemolysin activation/secretion protein [Solimicrobium silvestre]